MAGISPDSANWLVGDRLACVLHLGDGPLAYELSEQGHQVCVAGDDVREVRNDQISYVRCKGDRLPFRSCSFDAIVAPKLRESPLALAEFARVLSPDGVLSTVSRHYDDSVPWTRRLREITGDRATTAQLVDTFSASGLFAVPQSREFNSWEDLDLAALMRFAQATRHPSVPVDQLAQVTALWREYTAGAASLRLRHETVCLRARVDKSALADDFVEPDVVLIDFR